MTKRLHLLIHGRVQGVCYRAETAREAARLGLVGWVRNLPTGDVEVAAEGEETDVRALLRWCEHGPPAAEVTGIDSAWEEPIGTFQAFRVRE